MGGEEEEEGEGGEGALLVHGVVGEGRGFSNEGKVLDGVMRWNEGEMWIGEKLFVFMRGVLGYARRGW